MSDYPTWLREAASKGGSAATAAKARAARRNGRKGGRPKKPNAERHKVAAVGVKMPSTKRRAKSNKKLCNDAPASGASARNEATERTSDDTRDE